MNRRNFLFTASLSSISANFLFGQQQVTNERPLDHLVVLVGGTLSRGSKDRKLIEWDWHTDRNLGNPKYLYSAMHRKKIGVFGRSTAVEFPPADVKPLPLCTWPQDQSKSKGCFSWQDKTFAVPIPTESIEIASERLFKICMAAKECGILKISLVGHSAGASVVNFVLNKAASEKNNSIKFEKVVLCAPPVSYSRATHPDFQDFRYFPNPDAIKSGRFFNIFVQQDIVLRLFQVDTHYHTNWIKNCKTLKDLHKYEDYVDLGGTNHWGPVTTKEWNKKRTLGNSSGSKSLWDWIEFPTNPHLDPIMYETQNTSSCCKPATCHRCRRRPLRALQGVFSRRLRINK